MAPGAPTMEDFDFIMTCYKHFDTKPKVNFDAVAAELGAKSANAWSVVASTLKPSSCPILSPSPPYANVSSLAYSYHRHWGILKKWGLAGNGPNAGRGRKAATPKKRKSEDSDGEGEADDAKTSPTKKSKATPKKAAPVDVKEEESEDGAGAKEAGADD